MFAKPQEQHEWLAQLAGEWTYLMTCNMGPDQPPMQLRGNESVRTFGGLWVIGNGEGETPSSPECGSDGNAGGGAMNSIITLGYDTRREIFVGTFTANVSDHMWSYEGKREGNKLTLDTTGPSFTDPTKTIRYQDIVEIKSANERTLSSQFMGDDGQWVPFMTATYTRV